MSDKKKEDPITTKMILETLDESIMILSLPYTKLKRLEGMGVKTIRDFRDYEFDEDEDQSLLNSQEHFRMIWGGY